MLGQIAIRSCSDSRSKRSYHENILTRLSGICELNNSMQPLEGFQIQLQFRVPPQIFRVSVVYIDTVFCC